MTPPANLRLIDIRHTLEVSFIQWLLLNSLRGSARSFGNILMSIERPHGNTGSSYSFKAVLISNPTSLCCLLRVREALVFIVLPFSLSWRALSRLAEAMQCGQSPVPLFVSEGRAVFFTMQSIVGGIQVQYSTVLCFIVCLLFLIWLSANQRNVDRRPAQVFFHWFNVSNIGKDGC